MAFQMAYRFVGPADPLVKRIPVAANQTIVRGGVVGLTSGKAVVAAPGATNVLGVALDTITTGANPGAGEKVGVVVSGDVVFRANYVGSEKTSLTQADVGTKFDIVTGGQSIDLDETTNGFAQVVEFDNDRKVAYVLLGGRVFNCVSVIVGGGPE